MLQQKEALVRQLNSTIAEKDSILITKDEEISTMTAQVEEMKSGDESNVDLDNVMFEYDMKLQDAIDKHQEEVAQLESKVREKEVILAKKEVKHKSFLRETESKVTSEMKEKHQAEIEDIKKNYIEKEHVDTMENNYRAEIISLQKAVKEENDRLLHIEKEYSEKLADLESRLHQEIQTMKESHDVEIKKLMEQHDEEKEQLKIISKNVEVGKKNHDSDIELIKRDYQTAISEVKKNIMNESNELIANDAMKKKKEIKDPPIEYNSVASLSGTHRLENISEENELNVGDDIAPKTPMKTTSRKDVVQVSPLTMTSPVAQHKRKASRSNGSAESQGVPSTIDGRRKRRSRSTLDSNRSVQSLPVQRSATKKISSPSSVKSSASYRRRTDPRTTPTISSKLRSSMRSRRSSASVADSVGSERSRSSVRSSGSKNRHDVSPPTMRRSDLKPVQMQAREGLFSCEKPLPEFGEIRLLIINVPITDRRRKMAKALNIELVKDPLNCTHAIVGDADNHIRRTAKLMAVLCVTNNILRSEWLDDCYKHRLIISTSHHTLLNDYLAEKAYSFSMKSTLKEGAERRKYGGLFCGWKILICNGVAGNKAPKEAEFRMMIQATGGTWLEYDDIPVSYEEDPSHVVVITSDPPTEEQLKDKIALKAAKEGAGFHTTSWLFDVMMHQKLFGMRRGIARHILKEDQSDE